jgi:hypothetical protein
LKVEGKEFKVHKLILACVSYFDSMFSGNFKEVKRKKILIQNISASIFEDIMHFIYKGEVEITDENMCSLLKAGDMPQIKQLCDGCSEYLKMSIDVESCLSTWKLAEEFSLDSLSEKAKF